MGDSGRSFSAVLTGNRAALARAITLVESERPDRRIEAAQLIDHVLPHAGNSIRIGISGAPGAGKSTFIDSLGTRLVAAGHKVAVLAIDPSSSRTGGSILGDKTRMARLSMLPDAYIRPSPSRGALGGVAARTREAMILCEAAGFDVIIVETVGVGQSETAVADLTDFFLVLALPGAGDELQGIKKGIVELADAIAVNKADGATLDLARAAAAEYRAALHILAPVSANWTPRVLTVSALKETGFDELWSVIQDHRKRMTETGERAARRGRQDVLWMWRMVEERMRQKLISDEARQRIADLERAVATGHRGASLAAEEIVALYARQRACD